MKDISPTISAVFQRLRFTKITTIKTHHYLLQWVQGSKKENKKAKEEGSYKKRK